MSPQAAAWNSGPSTAATTPPERAPCPSGEPRTATSSVGSPDDRDHDASVAATAETAKVRMNVLARQGLSLPRNVTTTYHLGAAYPFAVEAGLGVKGAFMGLNRLSGGGGFFFDLFEAHAAGLITAPNMCVTGAGGFGGRAPSPRRMCSDRRSSKCPRQRPVRVHHRRQILGSTLHP